MGDSPQTAVACTSSWYIKGGCKFRPVGFADVFQRVIALGISYGGVRGNNAIHYTAHPIGRPGGRCSSRGGAFRIPAKKKNGDYSVKGGGAKSRMGPF